MEKRRAKIICTLGPASSERRILFRMIREGMDVARFNFSHGSHESHGKLIGIVRESAAKLQKPVSILQDLQGIKIRVGKIKGGERILKKGSEVAIYPGYGEGDEKHLYVSYPLLLKDARKDERILLDDGMMELKVIRKTKDRLIAKVVEGGIIKNNKGVNFPGMKISQKAFTEKDKTDLDFGLRMNVDYVAVSFVRSREDIKTVKNWIKKKGKDTPVIAKIEKPQALLNIDEILDEADCLMIARGDLGVEVPPENVPLIQKELIDKANERGKIVITATQMLESMKEHLRPTRAEATDVANAVIDGTDALMLSAETSSGIYPLESVKMMDRIISHTEKTRKVQSSYIRGKSYADALADAACRAAEDIRAKVLVAFTRSGFTARLVSKFRPHIPIIVYTPSEEVMDRLPLFWGITPRYMRSFDNTDDMLREAEKDLLAGRIVKNGDRVVIIASSPLSAGSRTNFMKLHQISGK